MKKNANRKVLFISYLFPPVGGGGVQRSSKFVKYLPEFGWRPLVLTVKEPYDFDSDDTLLNDLSDDVKVYRTFSIEPMKWVRKFLKKKWQKQNKRLNKKDLTKKSLKPNWLVKLKTYLLVPDNEILWLPFAVWRGWRIIRYNKPDIIYSTASPFTDHLIALILCNITKLPWIADFRDMWVDRPNFPKTKWRLFIDRKLEKKVIKKADHIVTSTSFMAERFKQLYKGDKYSEITNGYDEDDFIGMGGFKPFDDKFRISYTGILNVIQNPQKVFLAIKNLIDKREDLKDKLVLRFVGRIDDPGDFENINYLKKLGLEKYTELIPYQPHHQVIDEMHKASVLLLFIGEYPHSDGILTGKIFEYLRSGKPVLAVVPENGLAAEVIRKTNSGVVAANDDVEKISETISKLFDLFIANKLEKSFKRNNIEEFSRKDLTKILADIFNDTIKPINS